jgi:two-component system, NtrC family, sensor histidine kinase KinB
VTLLSKLDDMSKNLVATFAHEFRTPLTSLHLAVHILLEQLAGTMTEKQLDLIYAAREDCERLRNLVDDILSIVRVQSGKLELRRLPVRVAPLIEHVVDHHRFWPRSGDSRCPPSRRPFGEEVFADPERLELVFANLITNAIRHTPAGGSIEIRALPEGEFVRFEVKIPGKAYPKNIKPRSLTNIFRFREVSEKERDWVWPLPRISLRPMEGK